MNIYAQERIIEITERLSSLWDELSVEPTLRTFEGNICQIEFWSDKKDIFSPVEITLGKPAASGEAVSNWSGSIHWKPWNNCSIGDNGWIFQQAIEGRVIHELPGDADLMFAEIEQHIRTQGLVYTGSAREKFTCDQDFGYLFFAVEDVLPADGETKVICKREKNGDTFNFVDDDDRKWNLAFEERNVIIRINDVVVETLPNHDLVRISDAMRCWLPCDGSNFRF